LWLGQAEICGIQIHVVMGSGHLAIDFV